MAAKQRESPGRLEWLSSVAAALAFIACNGLVVIVAMLSLFGITIAINPHLQAAAISLFALLTFGLVFVGYKKHRKTGPLLLSAAAAVLLIGTMYISFNKIVESVGLVALIASAVWSWRITKAHTCAESVPRVV